MNDELRQRALKLLARREHSRAELTQKLSKYGESEDVSRVLDSLESSGLLSDMRFVESYVRSHAARFGVAKLRHTLRSKGIAGELIEARLSVAELGDEQERALAVWQRKFGSLPADAREWARQARFLQGRGFSTETIRRILRNKES